MKKEFKAKSQPGENVAIRLLFKPALCGLCCFRGLCVDGAMQGYVARADQIADFGSHWRKNG